MLPVLITEACVSKDASGGLSVIWELSASAAYR